ncbi:site-specific integrase [Salinispora cortesiana]|uniref:site-specific integrase n=1 Tax=Salinispora cortesiana TaxID=1305843 RepID=UPI00040284AD|nr:hypothetical protein [Salinispora cortesiana]
MTESDKLRGSYVDPVTGRMTFAEYAETWLRTRSFDKSTRESAEFRVRKYPLPFLRLAEAGRDQARPHPGMGRGHVGKLAPATRAVVFAHLRTILGAAVDDERITKNPCSAKSVKPPRPVQRRVVPWRYAQISAIRGGLAQRYRPMVDLGAGCGSAAGGEILGLGVDDIDFDAGWVHVCRQVKLVRSRLVFGLPKSDRDRRIPLLFTTTRRGAINRRTFDNKSWRPAVVAAGITPTRFTGMTGLLREAAGWGRFGGDRCRIE